MANFKNFTKLQLIVERTNLGADSAVGGDYVVTSTVTGTPTADANMALLGQSIPVLIADTTEQVATKIAAVFDALLGVTSSALGTVVTINYGALSTIPTLASPEVSNGITNSYGAVDNRDTSVFLKHSEYEDTEAGLILATAAMYSLVAASALTDKVQMQRIKLSDSDTTLVTDDVTLQVTGKNYQAYTV